MVDLLQNSRPADWGAVMLNNYSNIITVNEYPGNI